jgi:hypothetical protein
VNGSDVDRVRLIASRLVLDLLRITDDTRLRVGTLTSDELIIGLAVISCEREGRPLTINKLAYFIGLPRSTAARHVGEMIAKGHLTRGTRGELLLAYPIDETAILNARRAALLIMRAAAELSKLG